MLHCDDTEVTKRPDEVVDAASGVARQPRPIPGLSAGAVSIPADFDSQTYPLGPRAKRVRAQTRGLPVPISGQGPCSTLSDLTVGSLGRRGSRSGMSPHQLW